ncbi:hypothetical protein FACS1894172_17760 [Spirochaetia bacterium]|nr:hypothetical protein FACS1894164_15680 [Spirochaetia bacterium]GHU35664.1 hypothetical protein FACS1894172_17760 [Spirochaetia bacterium]
MKTTRDWSKMFLVGMAAMVLVFGLVLVGCDSGGGGGGSGKPAKLKDTATYQQALDKCDEIIAYCNSHSGTANDNVKFNVQYNYKPLLTSSDPSQWSTTMQASMVLLLNNSIASLQ